MIRKLVSILDSTACLSSSDGDGGTLAFIKSEIQVATKDTAPVLQPLWIVCIGNPQASRHLILVEIATRADVPVAAQIQNPELG